MSVQVNDIAPQFTGIDIISGSTFDLSAHSGEVVVIVFAGLTWCGPCMSEAPHMQAAWESLQGTGVQIVYISVNDDEASLLSAISRYGLTMPVIKDDDSIWNLYGFGGVPTMVIVDREGIVRSILGPIYDEETIKSHILDIATMRDPIDVAMIMDASGSMKSSPPGDPDGMSKMALLQQTCSIITDFLNEQGQPNDRMGLIWFSNDAFTFSFDGNTLLTVGNYSTQLNDEINAKDANGCTAMGPGLQMGLNLLDASPNNGVAILCTDGMQNVNPKVTEVGDHLEIINSGGDECSPPSTVVSAQTGVDIAGYGKKIHTVGIGITASYGILLDQMASSTDAFYLATDEPENDLDLAYFVHLCDVFSDNSPEIVHHSASAIPDSEETATEKFLVNQTARKLTIILSWPNTRSPELTIWVRRPDGADIPVQGSMIRKNNYVMATIRLPLDKEGVFHVGEWEVLVSSAQKGPRNYHLIALVDDHKTKIDVNFRKRRFIVGDPIAFDACINLEDRPVTLTDLKVHASNLPRPLAEIVADYHSVRTSSDPINAFSDKLTHLSKDPRYRRYLIPQRRSFSWQDGNLDMTVQDETLKTTFVAEKPGLLNMKIVAVGVDKLGGPIQRTTRVSLFIEPSKVDISKTKIAVTKMTGKVKGTRLVVTPKSAEGHLLGPGRSDELVMKVGGKPVKAEVIDDLNGTYRISTLSGPKGNAVLMMANVPIWKETTKRVIA